MKILKYKLSCIANFRKFKLMLKYNKSEFIVLVIMSIFCLLFFRDSNKNFGIELNNLIPILILILSLLNLMNGNPLLKVRYQDLVNKCITFRAFKYKTIVQLILGRVISYFIIIILFKISKVANSQLIISLVISYCFYLFSVLQYNIKYSTIVKGIILVLALSAYWLNSIILINILSFSMTLVWIIQKKFSYTELFEYYISYESLRQGILMRDNNSVQSAQSNMFDKKSKASFTVMVKEYKDLNLFYLRYEITNLIRKGKSLIVIYLTMIILYSIKTALGFSVTFDYILLLFTIGSMQIYIYNQKSIENRALQNGYYLRYPIKILLKTKYVAIIMIAVIPFIFYWILFNFSIIIVFIFLYIPLQITCGYFLKNRYIKIILNIPTLLLISLIM